MTENTVFVGLDTSKDAIAVAIVEEHRDAEIRYMGQIANEPAAVLKLVKKLAGKYNRVSFCYEAGPCGYRLQRQIVGLGHECIVVAPSHTPVKKGLRIKIQPAYKSVIGRRSEHPAPALVVAWHFRERHSLDCPVGDYYTICLRSFIRAGDGHDRKVDRWPLREGSSSIAAAPHAGRGELTVYTDARELISWSRRIFRDVLSIWPWPVCLQQVTF